MVGTITMYKKSDTKFSIYCQGTPVGLYVKEGNNYVLRYDSNQTTYSNAELQEIHDVCVRQYDGKMWVGE